MEIIKIKDLSFRYPQKDKKALSCINLTISRGEFITVCGKSGCGKTTLLRLLKSVLSPCGETNGEIFFCGRELSSYDDAYQAANIGFVMQNPDNQIVTDKVWHELAFGLESLGVPNGEIRTRVSEMASFFGMHSWFHKNVSELSGGQKQMLNLASVMVMQPSVLILDEPTSQLDPISATEFLKVLERINQELGVTVILTEHRLEEAFPISHRVLVMEDGKIIADESPKKVGELLREVKNGMYRALPTPMRIWAAVSNSLKCPLTVRDGREWLEKYSSENPLNQNIIPKSAGCETSDAQTVVEISDVWFRYEKDLPDIIKGMNLKIFKGEIFSILGGNGSGKTTLLSLISAINTPHRGKVLINGESPSEFHGLYQNIIGFLPQNPQIMFSKKTVLSELVDIAADFASSKEEAKNKAYDIASLCRIENLSASHPYDLSGGEQQRVALAMVLLKKPEILLLDEPTKGMDSEFKEEFAQFLSELKAKGTTIVMVSHDIEFCAANSDRCTMVFDGDITRVGAPREFFAGNSFYTTAANRMARDKLPGAIFPEDVILACQGVLPQSETQPKKESNITFGNTRNKIQPKNKKNSRKGLIWEIVISVFFLLLSVPLTMYGGIRLFGGRKYYFISLLIILEAMVPFGLMFERRRPQARELVIISVLCALAVAARSVFVSFPQFKPVVALIIISGISFGAETGFLVGAITGFVSNFFFGQGPWTPWQMFALGITGFVSGLVFKSKLLKKSKTGICIFGFLACFILYGGIVNLSFVFQSQTVINSEMIMAAYASGAPFDLVHAFSTMVFLWLIAMPMTEKLERVKVKYGLIN